MNDHCKLGTHEFFADNLREACLYLNERRPDIRPEWIIQIAPSTAAPPFPHSKAWTVVYRWYDK